jgi:hypothetical protein
MRPWSGVGKNHFDDFQFHSNNKEKMALHKWLQKKKPNFYCNRIFKVMPRWDICTSVLTDYVKNNNISVE